MLKETKTKKNLNQNVISHLMGNPAKNKAILPLDSRIKSENDKVGESGRSMVEMLGVLAIIGVLSVTGIAAYTTAMNQHRANETLNQALRLATIISGQRALNPSATLSSSDLAGTKFQMDDSKKDKIVLTVTDVPEKVANRIKAMGLKNATPTIGADGTLTFTFKNDLSEVSGDSNDTTSDDEGVWEISQGKPCTEGCDASKCEKCVDGICVPAPDENNAACSSCPSGYMTFGGSACVPCNWNMAPPADFIPNCETECPGKRSIIDESCALTTCPAGYERVEEDEDESYLSCLKK